MLSSTTLTGLQSVVMVSLCLRCPTLTHSTRTARQTISYTSPALYYRATDQYEGMKDKSSIDRQTILRHPPPSSRAEPRSSQTGEGRTDNEVVSRQNKKVEPQSSCNARNNCGPHKFTNSLQLTLTVPSLASLDKSKLIVY